MRAVIFVYGLFQHEICDSLEVRWAQMLSNELVAQFEVVTDEKEIAF